MCSLLIHYVVFALWLPALSAASWKYELCFALCCFVLCFAWALDSSDGSGIHLKFVQLRVAGYLPVSLSLYD